MTLTVINLTITQTPEGLHFDGQIDGTMYGTLHAARVILQHLITSYREEQRNDSAEIIGGIIFATNGLESICAAAAESIEPEGLQ